MPSPNPDIAFQQAPAARWIEGLSLVLEHLPARARARRVAELVLEAQQQPEMLAGLFLGLRGDKTVAAIWAQPQAGRTALVWGPEIGRSEKAGAEIAQRLIERAVDYFAAREICVLQALPRTDLQARWLGQAGFDGSLQLAYLTCSLTDVRAAEPPQSACLTFEQYRDTSRERLAAVIEATYEGTLDAPQLDGKRTREDIVDGYLATAHDDPSLWWLVLSGNKDVGCLLLANHTEHDHVELLYMGLIPTARGKGGGAELVKRAIQQAAATRQSQLILAVDATNDPAIRVYEAAGFQSLRRQSICLKFLEA